MQMSPLNCKIPTDLKKRFKAMCSSKGILMKEEIKRIIENEVEAFELTPQNEREGLNGEL